MRILVLANFGMGLYKFRKELLEELLQQNHDVYIALPNDEYVQKLKNIGCKFIETHVDRRGTNPFTDFKLLLNYIRIIKGLNPHIVLTYTIKPNIYGGIACRLTRTPYIANITGLGTTLENSGFIQKLVLILYRIGLKKASCIFFQNENNRKFLTDKIGIKGKTRLIPGSGVNLEQYQLAAYPESPTKIKFLFIGRIMKAKGIDELLEAAKLVKEQYTNVEFEIIGFCEENFEQKLNHFINLGIISFHGQQDDVRSFIKNAHAIILPSYHEGTANVLLEAAATGRPILASNIPGCKETFDEGVSGFGFEVRNVQSLVNTIIKFIELPYEKKRAMGIAGRRKMEKEFDRNIVINAYLEEIDAIVNKETTNESIQ